MLLQFGRARESKTIGGQENLIPNLKVHNSIELIIVSILSLLCMLYSSIGFSNGLLHQKNRLSISLTLNPYANHNIYGVSQLLPKNTLSWREFILELT